LADVAHEAAASRRCFINLLISAITVETDGGAADKNLGLAIELAKRFDNIPGGYHARVSDDPLLLIAPAPSYDRFSCKIDYRFDFGKSSRGKKALLVVPLV